MATLEWLKKEFDYGYDSGSILSDIPDEVRASEETKIGGSYKKVFLKAIQPYIQNDSKVLELGPGKGSWTKAILQHVSLGQVDTLDFQDVNQWINPELYKGRLHNYKIENNDYSFLRDDYYDFFWSFGVLCHNNSSSIKEILQASLPKLKKGGVAIHQYSDWDKLEKYGWKKGAIPEDFKNKDDNEMWWPRNNQETMRKLATEAEWEVLEIDMGLVQRDSIVYLKKL